jgi:hypothetical protein
MQDRNPLHHIVSQKGKAYQAVKTVCQRKYIHILQTASDAPTEKEMIDLKC